MIECELKPLEHLKEITDRNYVEAAEASAQHLEKSNFLDVEVEEEESEDQHGILFFDGE